jgi:nucleoid DNA-binding protein
LIKFVPSKEALTVDVIAIIRELLFGHDCVIVPGFGGFIGNYAPARIDKDSGTFYPPVKQISFNRNLNHNDGLLIGRISVSSGINYGDARSLVEDFVADIRKKLERGEKIVFDNIGNFINNQEGNVQFEPDKSANYHLDSYGLEPFQCLPLEGYDVRKRISRHIEKDPVKQALVRKIIWRAAVIIPLLALIVTVPLKTDLFRGKVEATTMNPLVTAEFENNKKALEESAKPEPPKVKEDPAPVPEKQAEAVSSVAVTSESNAYVVITGSFKSKQNADSQANKLIEEGFSPEIVTTTNGFYRVCAIACNDMKTAVVKKDSIVKKFPGTWVSKKI